MALLNIPLGGSRDWKNIDQVLAKCPQTLLSLLYKYYKLFVLNNVKLYEEIKS